MQDRFIADVQSNTVVRAILAHWPRLGLADGWLVAGCLAQTVWNRLSDQAPEAAIRDYDLFYFDAGDLSWAAEDQVIRRVGAGLGDLGCVAEVRNQARVHLWYPQRFGSAYPPLGSARDGIDRFLVPCTSLGVRPAGSGLEIYAPYGLDDLYAGVLRPNPLNPLTARFQEKCRSYQARWPWLTVLAG